jgi:hypothetical protein
MKHLKHVLKMIPGLALCFALFALLHSLMQQWEHGHYSRGGSRSAFRNPPPRPFPGPSYTGTGRRNGRH